MHVFLVFLLSVCALALLVIAGYATWRIRQHLAAARRAPKPPKMNG